jgi:hypothetical protein
VAGILGCHEECQAQPAEGLKTQPRQIEVSHSLTIQQKKISQRRHRRSDVPEPVYALVRLDMANFYLNLCVSSSREFRYRHRNHLSSHAPPLAARFPRGPSGYRISAGVVIPIRGASPLLHSLLPTPLRAKHLLSVS